MSTDVIHPTRLAAIVYDDCVSIDQLMAMFARELMDRDVDICGLLQIQADKGCGPDTPMQLCDLRSGEVLPLCQALGSGAQSCKLDGQAMSAAAQRLCRAAEGPSDVIFISKFGKQEIEGRGFRDAFATATAQGRTVLTAVKRGHVHKWLEFTGGVGTLLDTKLWVLRDWWSDVALPAV